MMNVTQTASTADKLVEWDVIRGMLSRAGGKGKNQLKGNGYFHEEQLHTTGCRQKSSLFSYGQDMKRAS